MKEKIRNLFDEMKVRSRYKSMSDIINMIEPIVNQEVERRIKKIRPTHALPTAGRTKGQPAGVLSRRSSFRDLRCLG